MQTTNTYTHMYACYEHAYSYVSGDTPPPLTTHLATPTETEVCRPTPYLDMASENSSEFLAFFSKALPSGLKPCTSLRVHWLVFRMKLQSWGTSSST